MTLNSAEPRLRAMGMAATILLAVALASCSSGSKEATPPPSTVPATTTVETTTTEPPSTDEAAVRARVSSLLRKWDVAMTALREHPTEVIGQPDDPRRQALAKIFTSDSPYTADIDKVLSGYSSGGVTARPTTGDVVQHTTYLRTTESPTPDSVTFVWCSFDDSTSVRTSTGKVANDQVGITQGGGEAQRVDGQWRLHRLFQLTHTAKPKGTANPCPSLVTPSKAGN